MVELEVNFGEIFEYKYIIVIYGGDVIWEGGLNCVLLVFDEGEFEVVIYWGCIYEEF